MSHETEQRGLSKRTKYCYAFGHIENDLTASCWFSYLLVFLRTVLLFPSATAGLLLLIGQVSDGLATPLAGLLSDKTESSFGKRRLWILVGAVCVTFTFPFIFHSVLIDWFNTSDRLRLVYYAFFVALFQFAWAATQVNHLALVPELSKRSSDRVFLNSVRSIATILSNVAVFVIAGSLLSHGSPEALGPNDANSFFTLAMICVGVGAVCSAIFICGVPDPPSRPKPEGSEIMEWHHWIRHRSFYATAIIYTGTRIMTNITQVFLPLYLVLSLNAPKGMIASIPFTIFASSFLSTMACERLTHRMGSEKLTMLGSLIVLASSFGWGFIRPDIVHWAYLFAITAGFGIGLVGVSALGLICEMVGDDCESSAFVYGSMSFFDKITNGVVIMLVEGCVPDDLSAASYYRKVQVYVPSTAAIAAIILLTFILMTRPVRPVITSPCARLMRINSGVMANGLSSVPVMHDHSANSNVNENTPLLSRV